MFPDQIPHITTYAKTLPLLQLLVLNRNISNHVPPQCLLNCIRIFMTNNYYKSTKLFSWVTNLDAFHHILANHLWA